MNGIQEVSGSIPLISTKKAPTFVSKVGAFLIFWRFSFCWVNSKVNRKRRKKLFRCILQALITTGLRRGECLGLQWSDIDFQKENRVHTVPDRIVSISQPWVRPIVRGKAHANTEFGVGKRSYGLNRIMAHLKETSFCVIGIALLCMNLAKRLRSLLRHFLRIWFSYRSQPHFRFLGACRVNSIYGLL